MKQSLKYRITHHQLDYEDSVTPIVRIGAARDGVEDYDNTIVFKVAQADAVNFPVGGMIDITVESING